MERCDMDLEEFLKDLKKKGHILSDEEIWYIIEEIL
jgi:hypothetical protein